MVAANVMALENVRVAAEAATKLKAPPIRVLHVHPGNLFGGVETLLVTFAREQSLVPALQHQFALCVEGRLSKELCTAGAPVHFLGKTRARSPVQVWAARAHLQRILRVAPADVLVCHSTWAQALFGPVLRNSDAKLVFWLHMGLGTIAIPELWAHWMARRTRPDLAICASQFTMGTLCNLYPNLAAQVLYSPVSSGERGSADRLATRRQLGTRPDDLVIIQTSRLERWKGHMLHLMALSRLRDVTGWTCWMVGGAQRPKEETYLRQIRQLAIDLGIGHRVHFLGQRSDVPALLRAADVHCQPNTEAEPFGIAFVEALYAGLPVVTTAIGGAKEIVDETCGLLVKPGDPAELSEALLRLIRDRTLLAGLAAGGPPRGHALCNPARQLSKLRAILDVLKNSPVAA